MYNIILLVSFTIASLSLIGQQPLTVGDYLPAYAVEYLEKSLPQKDMALRDAVTLRILNFCAPGCKNCVDYNKTFEQLKQTNGASLEIINITNSPSETVEQARTFHQIEYNVLPFIIDDTLLNGLFSHSATPHLVWLNRQNRILAITPGYYARPENIKLAMKGETLPWRIKKDIRGYDYRVPIAILSGKPTLSSPVFMTALTNKIEEVTLKKIEETVGNHTRRLRIYNLGIIHLYINAINGIDPQLNIRKHMIVEIKNRDRFYYDTALGYLNEWEARNLYYYQSDLPISFTKKDQYQVMLEDLNRYFNLDGRVERRSARVWIIKDRKKKMGSMEPLIHNDNISLKEIVVRIKGSYNHPMLIDETSNENRQWTESPAVNNASYKVLKKAFRKHGIRMQKKKRQVDMFILTEK